MDDEKLIANVESYPCLYDFSHKHYNDPVKKEKVWNDIGKALHQPGITCKTRWSNLRDQFRRVTKSRRALNGEPADKKKRWKYDEEMAFLKPFYHERSSIPNASCDPEGLVEVNWQEVDDTIELVVNSGSGQKQNSEAKERDKNSSKTSMVTRQHKETAEDEGSQHSTASKTKIQPFPHQTTEKPSSFLEMLERSKDVQKSTSHIDAFLYGIAETIKTFPPIHQHVAKSKIFNAVSEIEMEILMKSQASVSHTDSEKKVFADSP
ncbi:uncharacterized protein [Palaemon carinicauda]|uniref:uncharacterized protein n=1 Tax=Palaemon carinicauda TaxID=392227 RepID=UPI0035B5ADEA